ncbi:MAG TPA: hypothetical protein PLT23_11680 [Lentisphaeria bacterium]|nr:hypothetical protein [Lentisphaerota bacterium]HPY91381.1 hypothetical protein [Lentisphaeria bacterium]HQL88300.1 hypothetical protein [Lentisphaeria bacterium]
MEEQKQLVIIGFGAGGMRAAASLRAQRSGPIASFVLAGTDFPEGADSVERIDLSAGWEPSASRLGQIIVGTRVVLLIVDLGFPCEGAVMSAVRQCSEQSTTCLAVAALPSSQASPERRQDAELAYADLLEDSDLAVGLDFDLLTSSLPGLSQAELEQAAAKWLLECARGVLAPFAPAVGKAAGKAVTTRGAPEQLSFELAEMSLGIFSSDNPSQYHGQNYDIPTFQRKGVKISW